MNFNEFFCLKYPYLFLLIPELYQYALLGALDQKSGDLFFLFFFQFGKHAGFYRGIVKPWTTIYHR